MFIITDELMSFELIWLMNDGFASILWLNPLIESLIILNVNKMEINRDVDVVSIPVTLVTFGYNLKVKVRVYEYDYMPWRRIWSEISQV